MLSKIEDWEYDAHEGISCYPMYVCVWPANQCPKDASFLLGDYKRPREGALIKPSSRAGHSVVVPVESHTCCTMLSCGWNGLWSLCQPYRNPFHPSSPSGIPVRLSALNQYNSVSVNPLTPKSDQFQTFDSLGSVQSRRWARRLCSHESQGGAGSRAGRVWRRNPVQRGRQGERAPSENKIR